MRTRVPRAESQARTRARLLEAAARVFTEHGFEGASVDAILAVAGLSKGALYANFASKEALFLAVLDRCLADQERALRDLIERESTLAARIAAIGRWAPDAMEDSRAWRLLSTEFWMHAARHPALQAELATRYAAQRAEIARLIIREFDAAGRTPPLPASQLASALVGLVNGLAVQQLIDPAAISLDLYASALALLLGIDRDVHRPGGSGGSSSEADGIA